MKFLYFLFLIFSVFIYSCGGDSVSQIQNKCPNACQDNAECDASTNKCVCLPDFHEDGNKCVKDVADLCKDKTCTDNATCNNDSGICVCDTGFHEDGNKCIENAADLCKDKTCTDNATCNNNTGICDCDTGYIFEEDKCVVDKCKDVVCSTNEQCSDGNCECKDGYFYSVAIEQCVKDEKCTNVTCDTGYSCLSGTCYLDNECSVINPTGVCPVIDNGVTLICKNGLCITENEGALHEGDTCNPTINDCVTGTVCVDSFQNKLFKCRAFCDLNVNNSCGDGVCAPYLSDFSQNTGICIKSDSECENNEDHCPEHFKCAMMINSRVCKADGSGVSNDKCDNDYTTELNGCGDGTFCVGDEGDMSCRELCDPELETSTCSEGRCVNLMEIDPTVRNNDIGLCLDLPNFCNTSNGVKDNPLCEDSSAVCLGDGSGSGMCFVDTCDANDPNSCDEGTACTRSFTSKLMCIPDGTLENGASGCVNPQDKNTDPNDIIPSKLCAQGLNCIPLRTGSSCMELCDPTASNSCTDSNATCIDIHNIKSDYPAGINGGCMSLGK